jgi:hypothetical protein
MQPTDERTQNGGRMVAEGIAKENPDFVCQLGDITSQGADIQLWHNTLLNLPLYSALCPFQTTGGNHDYGGDKGYNFKQLFYYNYAFSNGRTYSFDYLNAHFIMIDNFAPYVNYTDQDIQVRWVESDLARAKATGQQWIFVMFHHTIFTTGTSSHNWALEKWFVPLADRYDVDGVFFGHDHHYEHWDYTYGATGLLYNSSDTPSGNSTQYFCSGGGGAHLEVDYGLLTHAPNVDPNRIFYNTTSGVYQQMNYTKIAWNSSNYVINSTHQLYTESPHDFLYYHAPEVQSYSSDDIDYGYDYGEQTLQYMLVEISNNGQKCTISCRYPNGDLLMGPNNAHLQQWVYIK